MKDVEIRKLINNSFDKDIDSGWGCIIIDDAKAEAKEKIIKLQNKYKTKVLEIKKIEIIHCGMRKYLPSFFRYKYNYITDLNNYPIEGYKANGYFMGVLFEVYPNDFIL